jgi:hypothetical protein
MTEELMPVPKGYKILIAIPKLEKNYENSVLIRPEHHAKKGRNRFCCWFSGQAGLFSLWRHGQVSRWALVPRR